MWVKDFYFLDHNINISNAFNAYFIGELIMCKQIHFFLLAIWMVFVEAFGSKPISGFTTGFTAANWRANSSWEWTAILRNVR